LLDQIDAFFSLLDRFKKHHWWQRWIPLLSA